MKCTLKSHCLKLQETEITERICWMKIILTSFLGMGSCSFKMSLVGFELLPGGVEGPAGGVGVFTAAAGETVGVLTPEEPGPPLPPRPATPAPPSVQQLQHRP